MGENRDSSSSSYRSSHFMRLPRILNQCHPIPGFVYGRASFAEDAQTVLIPVRPRKRSTAICSGWQSCEARPLEQRRTSGGKARNTGLPKCGNVFSNHNCCLRLCNAELVPPASSGKKRLARQEPPKPPVYLSEWGGKFGITLAQITRFHRVPERLGDRAGSRLPFHRT